MTVHCKQGHTDLLHLLSRWMQESAILNELAEPHQEAEPGGAGEVPYADLADVDPLALQPCVNGTLKVSQSAGPLRLLQRGLSASSCKGSMADATAAALFP